MKIPYVHTRHLNDYDLTRLSSCQRRVEFRTLAIVKNMGFFPNASSHPHKASAIFRMDTIRVTGTATAIGFNMSTYGMPSAQQVPRFNMHQIEIVIR